MSFQLEEKLSNAAEKIGVEIGQKETGLFLKYLELLLEWNKNINLTAITDPEEILIKHFVDSIALIPFLNKNNKYKVLDVGTGAGFPGIPLKIVMPDINVVLLDSLNKRVSFLDVVIKELGLTGITTVHGRAEDFGKQAGYRDSFDIVTSRAVAKLSVLAELCIPFLKKGGLFASYKGAKAPEEIDEAKNALKVLGADVIKKEKISLPDLDDMRYIVFIEKKNSTPEKYPRKAGVPEKKPL